MNTKNSHEFINFYLDLLDFKNIHFLDKYLKCPSLVRLKKVGYFCGMDYGSKNVYDFREYISRYDHSLTTALLTYYYTKDKKKAITGLLHDISTPCFSHVIDYMNKDYENQESTEEGTLDIILKDKKLLKCLEEDGYDAKEVADFKSCSIVDSNRPKVCADRLDGVISGGYSFVKALEKEDAIKILENSMLTINEDGKEEIMFTSKEAAEIVYRVNNAIDEFCATREDMYMMQLLADIVKYAIDKGYIDYEELFVSDEEKLFKKFDGIKDKKFEKFYKLFKNIKLKDIPEFYIPNVKKKIINPLLENGRLKK